MGILTQPSSPHWAKRLDIINLVNPKPFKEKKRDEGQATRGIAVFKPMKPKFPSLRFPQYFPPKILK